MGIAKIQTDKQTYLMVLSLCNKCIDWDNRFWSYKRLRRMYGYHLACILYRLVEYNFLHLVFCSKTHLLNDSFQFLLLFSSVNDFKIKRFSAL